MENVSKVIHLPHSALHSYHLRVSLHYQFISRKFDEKNTEATCILISSSSMRTTHTHSFQDIKAKKRVNFSCSQLANFTASNKIKYRGQQSTKYIYIKSYTE